MRPVVRWLLMLVGPMLIPAALSAQQDWKVSVPNPSRPAFDYFVSRFQGIGEGSAEKVRDAVGGRLMWRLTPRAALGGYLVHAPAIRGGEEAWRYGAQADLRVADLEIGTRVQPILSLGIGALHEQVPLVRPVPVPPGRTETAELDMFQRMTLSVAPGLGVRIWLMPGLALRGDARRVIDMDDSNRRHFEFSGGFSLGG